MDQILLSQKEFAKFCNASPSTIHEAMQKEHMLKLAVVEKRIDVNNPYAKKYVEKLKERQLKKIKKNQKPVEPKETETITVNNVDLEYEKEDPIIVQREIKIEDYKPRPIDKQLMQIPHSVVDYLDYTVKQIYEQFGSAERFYHFLKSTQIIAAINEKNLKNAVLEGKLVSRESVQKNFFDPVNAAHLKLMSDGAKNLALTIKSKVLSGSSDAELEKISADIVSSFIKPVKSKMSRSLKNYEKNKSFETIEA